MKYLTAEKQPTQYYFRVNMDETKKLEDGSPDPIYVREFVWGLKPPEGQTEPQYLDNIKREIGLLVGVELDRMNETPPTSTILSGF